MDRNDELGGEADDLGNIVMLKRGEKLIKGHVSASVNYSKAKDLIK